jgi:hypothetical protein
MHCALLSPFIFLLSFRAREEREETVGMFIFVRMRCAWHGCVVRATQFLCLAALFFSLHCFPPFILMAHATLLGLLARVVTHTRAHTQR